MKKHITAFVLALVVMITGGLTNAESPKNINKAPQKIQKQVPPTAEQIKAQREKRMAEFNKAMGLTDEQIAKAKELRHKGIERIKPLIEKRIAKTEEIKKVKTDTSLTVKKQDKKIEALNKDIKSIDQKIKQIHQENEKAFKSILTDEQKVKFEQIKQEGKKHFKEYKMPQAPESFKH